MNMASAQRTQVVRANTLFRSAALLTFGLLTSVSQAQTSGTVVYARDDFNSRCYFTTATGDPDCILDANGFTTISRQANGGTYTFTARGEATVGGALRAQVSSSVSGVVVGASNASNRYQAQARAEYFDQVILTGTSVPAFLRFFVTIDGFAGQSSLHPLGGSRGEFRIGRYVSAPINGTAFALPTLIAGPTLTPPTDGTPLSTFIDLPVVQGVNYLLFGLTTGALVGAPTGTPSGGTWSGTAYADYFNTANITGTSVVNADGQVIEGAYASFEGGANLNVVPEPATWALLLPSLLVMGVAYRRASRRSV